MTGASVKPPSTPSTARIRCPSCGGQPKFDPVTSNVRCDHCGREEHIPQTAEEVSQQRFDEAAYFSNIQQSAVADRNESITCDGCGAVFLFEAPWVSGVCPFCSVHIHSLPKPSVEQVQPTELVPFRIDVATAEQKFREWIGSGNRRGSPILKAMRDSRPMGLYLPFWIFSTFSTTSYEGASGELANGPIVETTITREGKLKTSFGNDEGVNWISRKGVICTYHEDLAIPGVTNLPFPLLQSLSWDLNQACVFSSAHTLGFHLARYEVELPRAFIHAKQKMTPLIQNQIIEELGGLRQRITTSHTAYSFVNYRLTLLPVWLLTTASNGKSYHLLMNGSTGEITSDIPASWDELLRKVAFIVLVIVLLVSVALKTLL